MATGTGKATHLRRVTAASVSDVERADGAAGLASPRAVFTAKIEKIEGAALAVRPSIARIADGASPVLARLALIAGYTPTEGDVVLVAEAEEPIVIAVIEAARPFGLVAPDGARVELTRGGLEVSDSEGRLLVRYANGAAEITPARGDLLLRAPAGAVKIDAGTDVTIAARRDAVLEGARRAELRAAAPAGAELVSHLVVEAGSTSVASPKLEVRTKRARLVASGADVIAQAVRTSATTIETTARKVDLTAERVTTRAKDLVEEVADLVETRAGRVRSLVRGAFSLRSRTTAMKSKDDTSIDGRRVLLG